MHNELLEKLAREYHIPYMTLPSKDGGVTLINDEIQGAFFDRARVITELVARDNARQGNWTLVLSMVSLVTSVAAIIISILR